MEQENKKLCEAKKKERNEEVRVSIVAGFILTAYAKVTCNLW